MNSSIMFMRKENIGWNRYPSWYKMTCRRNKNFFIINYGEITLWNSKYFSILWVWNYQVQYIYTGIANFWLGGASSGKPTVYDTLFYCPSGGLDFHQGALRWPKSWLGSLKFSFISVGWILDSNNSSGYTRHIFLGVVNSALLIACVAPTFWKRAITLDLSKIVKFLNFSQLWQIIQWLYNTIKWSRIHFLNNFILSINRFRIKIIDK